VASAGVADLTRSLSERPVAQLTVGDGRPRVTLTLDPLRVDVHRDGRPVILGAAVRLLRGVVHDRYVRLTEGTVTQEDVSGVQVPVGVEVLAHGDDALRLAVGLADGGEAVVDVAVCDERVSVRVDPGTGALRCALVWPARPGERFSGLGARHVPDVDQSGRAIQLGADRRYVGPDCPPAVLAAGGVPQGDYAPVPYLTSSHGWSAWIDTYGNGTRIELDGEVALSVRCASGPLVVNMYTSPTAAARLRAYLRDTSALPALLPEWAYGHWKSRDVYEHRRDVEADVDGFAEHALPLDAVVLDSPWETTYNTWEPNPEQFPDFAGMVGRFRAAGVRTVVWTAPWTNLDSGFGQRAPDAESVRLSRRPAANYADGARAGHFLRNPDGTPHVARWWMGTGAQVDFTSPPAEAWWRAQAERVLALGVQGIKADDGEGYHLPADVRFADGRTGAQAAWAYGLLYRRSMQAALDRVHPGEGVLFGRSGWTGQQAIGVTWGGDQPSDFWSLRTLVAATLTAAASGFSNWSHDVGGYLGARLLERCPKELLIRWAQFGCFTPLMHAHGRFEQEPWTYDKETLELYRMYALLHERLVPYVRAAAATAARCGLPIVRPLGLIAPHDPRGWTVSDAYGYGPSLWVAPVLEAGAVGREVPLPPGTWIDFWTHERVEGGGTAWARAPLGRIPVFVRDGAIVPTYPAEHVAAGLGDAAENERPLELTVWGGARHERTGVTLADGTRVRLRGGRVVSHPAREVVVRDGLW
jgi:hypothetical protein